MNKFLKLMIIPAAFLTIGASTSCAPSPKEIALITDIGDINDGSFNQESWEAVKAYAEEHNKTYDFYRPFSDSDYARNCSIKQAVAKGAKIIVLPGFKFQKTCMDLMGKYPQIHFLLIDANPNDGQFPPTVVPPTENTCCVGFECEYSGFIAGYTVAQDLLQRDWVDAGEDLDKMPKNYGYGYAGGMATPGVYEFGFGYIQGIYKGSADFFTSKNIDVAAATNLPNIFINYTYAGVFAQHDPTAMKVKSWYGTDGVKVVFPCGGKLYQSITEAAQHYNKHQTDFNYKDWFDGKLERNPRSAARWIGVDSDQYVGLNQGSDKVSIYTSALKGLKPSIINTLDFHYKDEWDRIGAPRDGDQPGGGQVKDYKWILGLDSVFGRFYTGEEAVTDNFVGIPEKYDEETHILRGFDNFTYEQADTLRRRLATRDGGYIVYGGDGSEYGARAYYPDNMENWGNGEFRKNQLGNYPADKMEIKVE